MTHNQGESDLTTSSSNARSFPGQRLRRFRKQAGLSLNQLSTHIGCSESFLSKIENERANPSLSMLHQIVEALGITITSLFDSDSGNRRVVFHESERPRIRLESKDAREIILERLIPDDREHLLQANIHVVGVGGDSRGTISHEGEELGYVLDGVLELTVDQQVYRIEAGDCFVFRSEMAHAYRNIGDREARVLWVNTPVTF